MTNISNKIITATPKAVIFARVSSREQEQGQSIDAQLENLHKYCERKHIPILKEYKITESSTRGERKKFNEMLKFVKSQRNKIYIVADCVDRIQRSFKESIQLDELMQEDKIELHFVRECLTLSKDSETNDITRWDFSVMAAKTYVGNLRDNVKRSMKYNLEHGRFQHYAPLGYQNIRDANGQADVVLDPVRAPMVKVLFEKYATGNYSLRSLATLAKEMGLMARRKHNQCICKNAVRTMLTNPFYYGVMKIKKKYYTHKHPRLIDKALFDRVQDVLHGRDKSPTKMSYREREFATRDIIKCSCGCAITPEYHRKPSGKEYVYLKCSHFHKECQQQGLNENIILDQFKTEIFEKLYIPENMKNALKQEVRKQLEKDDVFNAGTKKSIELRLANLKDSKNRVLDLYIHGKIAEEVYEMKNSEIDIEEAELNDMMTKYQETDANLNKMSESIVELAGNGLKIFESSKKLEKNQLLKILVSNCVLDNKKARISLSEPFNLLLKTPSCPMWSK